MEKRIITEKLIRHGWTGKSGLYVSVIPDTRAKDIIRTIADVLETECDYDDLHCTIMYSPYDIPKTFSPIPKTKIFKARLRDIQLLGRNQDSLVITLDSKDLHDEHKRLKDLGARHSWENFSPHITIQTGKPFDDYYLESVVDTMNGREILLSDYSWDDILEEGN